MGQSTKIYLSLVLLAGMCVPQKATTFDLSAEFSFAKNPNGVWQYGYSDTKSLAPDQFRLNTYADKEGVVGFWHPAKRVGNGPGYYPYIAQNGTSESQTTPAKGWAIRPGEVAMEGSNSGQYSIVRFIAPADGTYKIEARFEGVHYHLSSTDVHVLHNGASLFNADIDGYGGDPAFHKVEGSNPRANYSGTVKLRTKDTIDFAVGYGKNQTHFNDTTSLVARVALLSPEGSVK